MDARKSVILAAALLFVGFASVMPAPSAAVDHCNCEMVTNFCGEVTTSPTSVPWVSCGISIFIFFIPSVRVIRTLGQLSKSNALFWWFLCLSCMSCLAWTGYSKVCEEGQSGYTITWTATTGVAIHSALLYFSTKSIEHDKVKARKMAAAISLYLIVMVLVFSASSAFNGWLALSFGVLAHLLRMKATDYDQFSWVLFFASVSGGVNGLIWLRHPSLCIIRQYKIASYIIAIIRGIEAFLWCSPWISTALWKMEEEGAEHTLNN